MTLYEESHKAHREALVDKRLEGHVTRGLEALTGAGIHWLSLAAGVLATTFGRDTSRWQRVPKCVTSVLTSEDLFTVKREYTIAHRICDASQIGLYNAPQEA